MEIDEQENNAFLLRIQIEHFLHTTLRKRCAEEEEYTLLERLAKLSKRPIKPLYIEDFKGLLQSLPKFVDLLQPRLEYAFDSKTTRKTRLQRFDALSPEDYQKLDTLYGEKFNLAEKKAVFELTGVNFSSQARVKYVSETLVRNAALVAEFNCCEANGLRNDTPLLIPRALLHLQNLQTLDFSGTQV
jgi:hypothetical protein